MVYLMEKLPGEVTVPNFTTAGTSIQSTISPVGGDYYELSQYTYQWQYYLAAADVYFDIAFATASSLSSSVYNQIISGNPDNKLFRVKVTSPGTDIIYSNSCEIITPGDGYKPIFSSPIKIDNGFTVNIVNYKPEYTWTGTTTEPGLLVEGTISGSVLPLTVLGLPVGGSSTIVYTTTRPGYPSGTGLVTGYAIGADVPPPSTDPNLDPPFLILDPPLPITDANTLASLGNLPGNTDSKSFVFPENELDIGYKTYSCKFNFEDCNEAYAAGMFFNMDAEMTGTDNTIFVELVRYKSAYAQYQETKDILEGRAPTWKWSWGVIAYLHPEGQTLSRFPELILGFADASLAVDYSDYKTPSVLVENPEYDPENPDDYPKYNKKYDKTINMKIVHYPEDPELGNTTTAFPEVLRLFINNVEIKNWYKLKYDTVKPNVLVKEIIAPSVPSSGTTPIVGKPKLPAIRKGTRFGVYTSRWSQYSWTTQFYANEKYNFTYNSYLALQNPPILSEIYATETALIDPHENYYHSSSKFLTDIAMNKKSLEKTYIMQTNPSVTGLNFYDVQYTTPAATNVGVYPISYLLSYVPSENAEDQKYNQSLVVDEDALNYSIPINTGFRAKMFIENNSPYLIFLKKEPDSKNTVTVNLNLWTHSIIAPSDQQIIESVIDPSNASEVVQIDSEWIQSSRAANKIMSAIAAGVDGFSKTIDIQVFGNPLIQVGDIVNFSYNLNGIQNVKYLVKRVSQSYETGLTTNLTLAKINV